MSTAHPKFLLLRSQNMVSGGTTNNCVIRLAESIHRLKAINLRRFSIPNTIYTIKEGINDAFCLDEGSPVDDIIVSPGVYTATGLASALETAFTLSSAADTYTVTYSSTTLHFSIQNNNNASFAVNWASHTNASRGMWYALGFNNEDYSYGVGEIAESVNSAMLSSPLSVLLRIPEFGCHSVSGSLPYTFDIPLNVNAGSLNYIASSADYPQRLDFGEAGRSFQLVSVVIIDHENNTVDFNGADWELLLELEYLPRRSDPIQIPSKGVFAL